MIKINHNFNRQKPSEKYEKLLAEYKKLHAGRKLFDGRSTKKFISVIKQAIENHRCKTILDYGAGQAKLYTDKFAELTNQINRPLQEHWGVEVRLYDPAVPEYEEWPKFMETFDGVLSIDVMEHIPEEDIGWVVSEIFGKAKQFVFLNIATFPALKTFKDGTNVHVSIYTPEEWLELIERVHRNYPYLTIYGYFDVVTDEEQVSQEGFRIDKLEEYDAWFSNTYRENCR